MDAAESVSSVIVKKLDRRPFINLLIGVSVGFGVGLAVHLLWRGIYERYDRKSRDDRLNDMLVQLTNLKSELREMRLLMRSSEAGLPHSVEPLDNVPFFYQPPDEDEEFFDVRSDDNEDDFVKLSSYPASSLNHASFYSATSDSFPGERIIQIGIPVPKEILTEMDRLAESALNEVPKLTADSSGDHPSWQPTGDGDEYSSGVRCYSHGLLYIRKYRRSPEFLWRFGRAIFLASESMPSEQSASDEMQDAPLSDVEVQSDAASLPSSHLSQLSLDPKSLNDMAYSCGTRRQLVQVGLMIARRALVLAHCLYEKELSQDPEQLDNPDGVRIDAVDLAQAYKWLAIYVGIASEFGGIKQKIVYGNEFKDLIDHATALNPSDAVCHHLKGRWCYEVYNITWIERQFASRLFGNPPTASLEDAEKCLNHVEQLQPSFYSANSLYLAKCCISRSDYKTAGTWLLNAKHLFDQNRLPPPFIDTRAVAEEVEILINKYQIYF